LNLEWFENLEHLNEKLQDWWHTYNFVRPHSAINYQTPEGKEQNTALYYKPVAA
jgi:transposase InsO family protein